MSLYTMCRQLVDSYPETALWEVWERRAPGEQILMNGAMFSDAIPASRHLP